MNRLIFKLSFFVTLSFTHAGVYCGAESAEGTRVYVQVKTNGSMMEIDSGHIKIEKKDGTVVVDWPITRNEIFNYYQGCMDKNCNKVLIALRAFKNRFHPINIRFIGPDYSTATTEDFIRVDNLLSDTERVKLAGNMVKVSKMDTQNYNAAYEFNDVVCVTNN